MRRPAHEVTASYEDAGLFKTAICQLMLELIPQMRRNDRQDLIVRGFVDRKTEIDVFSRGGAHLKWGLWKSNSRL